MPPPRLGCHAIRVNTGTITAPPRSARSPRPAALLTDYGVKNGIEIICENHGGPSSNPDALLAVIKAVGKPTFGTLPGLRQLSPGSQGKLHNRRL